MQRDSLNLSDTLRLSRPATLRWLEELSAEQPSGAATAYLPPGQAETPQAWRPRVAAVAEAAPAIQTSETGAVLFWSAERTYAVLPPFPQRDSLYLDGWDTAPLRLLLEHPYRYAVALVRLGRYAVGVYEGECLLASKTDTRLVHARHAAGGWSQQRFARRREQQARELFDAACSVLAERIAPYKGTLDYLLLGGERHTLLAFRKRCPTVEEFTGRILLHRLPSVREPNQAALERLPRQVWQSAVLVLEYPRNAARKEAP
ncbi:MAG: acVLRF1 family peptidyl-tRNA hydrolase [Chloroflexota bacterium]|nr:acVLRF1 family peptidyl-tRNA hydrolase [Chloroflexota bacterium]